MFVLQQQKKGKETRRALCAVSLFLSSIIHKKIQFRGSEDRPLFLIDSKPFPTNKRNVGRGMLSIKVLSLF
jgi:hypothetical protein